MLKLKIWLLRTVRLWATVFAGIFTLVGCILFTVLVIGILLDVGLDPDLMAMGEWKILCWEFHNWNSIMILLEWFGIPIVIAGIGTLGMGWLTYKVSPTDLEE